MRWSAVAARILSEDDGAGPRNKRSDVKGAEFKAGYGSIKAESQVMSQVCIILETQWWKRPI